MNSSQPVPLAELDEVVNRVVNETPVIDMHTHLYSQEFGDIGLWGIDELVNYHYLIAEVFRFSPISYASFWSMGKTAQADLIWKTLFHENAPISEATRGILTVLHGLGLDTRASNLNVFREYFRQYTRATYTDKVLKLAKVQSVVMTNDPFDENERTVWMASPERDSPFILVKGIIRRE